MIQLGTTSWSEHGLKMALSGAMPFYLWSNQGIIMYQRMLHVQTISIDDFLITAT